MGPPPLTLLFSSLWVLYDHDSLNTVYNFTTQEDASNKTAEAVTFIISSSQTKQLWIGLYHPFDGIRRHKFVFFLSRLVANLSRKLLHCSTSLKISKPYIVSPSNKVIMFHSPLVIWSFAYYNRGRHLAGDVLWQVQNDDATEKQLSIFVLFYMIHSDHVLRLHCLVLLLEVVHNYMFKYWYLSGLL